MKRKIICILVIALLIATTALPVVGTINIDKNQDVETLDESDGFQKPSRRLSNPLMLPPFLLLMVNGDWDYWSNSPHMFTIPDGNVGIGTSNPTSELEVVGNVEADSFTINGVPVGTSTDSYWSEGEESDIYYYGDVNVEGNLSVSGAIDPTWVWFTPQTTAPLDTTVTPNIPLEGTLYYDDNTDSFFVWTGGNFPIGQWTQLGADDDWNYNFVGPGNQLFPFYDNMIILFGSLPWGNYVNSPPRMQANAAGGARILGSQGNTPNRPAIGFFSTNGVDDGGGGNGIYRPLANTMAFATCSRERMRITPGGNIGIGTISPTQRLDVVGNLRVRNQPDSQGNSLNDIVVVDSTGVLHTRDINTLSDDDWLDPGMTPPSNIGDIYHEGKVSIGTISPGFDNILTVNGNTIIYGLNSALYFGDDNMIPGPNEWGEWGIEYWNQYEGLNFWKPSSSNNFGNNFLFLKDNGDVGISTPEPTTRLHINGPAATAIREVINPSSIPSSAVQITNEDSVIFASTTGVQGFVRLPKASTCPGREYKIKNIGECGPYSGYGIITVLPFVPYDDFIDCDSVPEYGVIPCESIVIVSDGIDHWYIIADYLC
jgi:hypothetical protein